MQIILNEKLYVEQLLAQLEVPDAGGTGLRLGLSERPAYDLRLMARYFAYEYHMTPHRIYLRLTEIMENSYDDFSLAAWQSLLLDMAKNAARRPLIQVDAVPVTGRELAVIAAIPEKPMRRLAFTLLCLAKYRNLANENNRDWINYAYKDIFKMANVSATIKEQCLMISKLCSRGLLRMNRIVDNLSLCICFVDHECTEVSAKVTDFRNLGYYYLHLTGEVFVQCRHCGVLMKPGKRNNKKYCDSCAPLVNIQKQRLRDHRRLSPEYTAAVSSS